MASRPPEETTPNAGETTDFDSAFASAAAESEGTTPPAEAPAEGEGTTPPAEAPAEGEGATPPAEAPAEGEGATPPAEGDGETEGGDGKQPAPVEEQPGAAAPEPKSEPKTPSSTDDVLERLADMMGRQQPKEPEAKPQSSPTEDPIYSEDEISVLNEYESNWPDVSKAEQLKRRAEYHDMAKYIFSEVANFVRPMQEQLQMVGNTLHLGELKQAVPDYSENLEADVSNWIETQPTYLQTAMKAVMQSGTSDEVADLIGRYRAASGSTPEAQPGQAQANPSPTPEKKPKQPVKTELSSAAKQAAESLAPVSGERSQIPQGEDPQDYSTAFSRYAASMEV